ncbi:MAG: ABC transporter ATP-binding protein [Trueperella sp.]|nr:ABC transporter ATP-binding protein [Trueperella sp.]
MEQVLQIADVTVRRSENIILDSVSWSVAAGQHWVILGPNGAGKTTLVQLIAGRMHPTTGTVRIIGEQLGRVNLADIWPLVGVASSAMDARIPGDQRVIDVVRTAAYGMTASWREVYEDIDQQRAESLLQQLGVGKLAQRRFNTISSGERKRVGIARALMPDPEVLILDEPASGLDLGGREQLLNSLTQLAASPYSPAMVLVTHHVEEIPPGITHALLLAEGRVHAAGPVDEVITGEKLSEVFGLSVQVEKREDRFFAHSI